MNATLVEEKTEIYIIAEENNRQSNIKKSIIRKCMDNTEIMLENGRQFT